MAPRDPSFPSPLAPARDRPPSSPTTASGAARALPSPSWPPSAALGALRAARPDADPRERLPFELRGLVNQLLGRHLRGEDVQRTLLGGPLHGRRYTGGAEAIERALDGTVHRYERIQVPVTRRRRTSMVVFVYAGTGPQLAMNLS